MIIDGKLVAKEIKNDLIKKIDKKNPKTLSVIQIGDLEESNIYINRKRKLALELGIKFDLYKYAIDVLEEEIILKINELNKTSNGIFIQLPIPNNLNKNKIINTIDFKKDVDGLTFINQGRLLNNSACLKPCTPSGIIKLLEYYNIDVCSKNVVIVGKSHLVGLPLANILTLKNATVTVCHSKTIDLESFTKKADILISATGVKHIIKKDMVKKEAVVIDVGIIKEDIIYGDVDFDKVAQTASFITPVPGGVGPMTVIMLMYNVINAKEIYDSEN